MSIKTLPTEILNQICGYLKPPDWCAFRSTCSALYTKSREAFVGRFFQSICMLVTRDSLKGLEGFAADDFIRKRLQELWIVPVLFEGMDNMSIAEFRDTNHPEEYFQQYQAEVVDHRLILESEAFQDTLTHCVSQFENLSTIGLQSLTMAYRIISQRESFPRCLGLRNLQRRVPCHRGAKTLHITRFKKTTVGRDHALVFSALLKAVTVSNRPLVKIDTCNDFHLGYTAAALNLIGIQESLIPILQGLETLHLCQIAEQPEDSSLDIMRDIIVEAASSLKNLTYGQWCPGQNMSPYSFALLSKRVEFTRLLELHLCWVEITHSSFEALLRTATPTLRVLSLHSVDLKDKIRSPLIPLEGGSTGDFKWTSTLSREMIQAWRRIWNIIRDELSLECLSLHKLGFFGHGIKVRDSLSHASGGQSTTKSPDVSYIGVHASVSFHEWINNLKADASRARGKDLPGGSVIGNFPRPPLGGAHFHSLQR
ncbi:hypothetical protein N7490_003086 [Penicillium lividum]|nr:hypothetical protein N7490_003086 [Penicillium lividum]